MNLESAPESAPIGMSVQVLSDYRKPSRQGMVGTIKKRYGTLHYTAFEVLFPDGQTQLFWDYQLKEIKQTSSRPRWRWLYSRKSA
jgi:hypothetical protein